jgi:hypothetical protein
VAVATATAFAAAATAVLRLLLVVVVVVVVVEVVVLVVVVVVLPLLLLTDRHFSRASAWRYWTRDGAAASASVRLDADVVAAAAIKEFLRLLMSHTHMQANFKRLATDAKFSS